MGVHGVKKLTPPPLLTFNACLKYLLGLLPRTKNADPRLLGVKKQPPRLLILLVLKPCWFINKIEPEPYQLLDGNYIINKGNAELHFKAIGVQDIRDAITKHKYMRNSRIDAISCCILQVALPYIEKALAYLLNASIGASTFPIVPFIVETR